jgi:hypothetical protein
MFVTLLFDYHRVWSSIWLSTVIHLYVGRHRSSLAIAASTSVVGETSSPEAIGAPSPRAPSQHRTQMDVSICWPPSVTGRDSIWWNPPLADEPPPLADVELLDAHRRPAPSPRLPPQCRTLPEHPHHGCLLKVGRRWMTRSVGLLRRQGETRSGGILPWLTNLLP